MQKNTRIGLNLLGFQFLTKLFILMLVLTNFCTSAISSTNTEHSTNKKSKLKSPTLSPYKLVDKLYFGLESAETEGLAEFFSIQIPRNIVDKFITSYSSEDLELKYKILSVKEKSNTATVKLKYRIIAPEMESTGQQEITYNPQKDIIKDKEHILVKENNEWKIRSLGEKEDKKVEEDIFFKCLNTVLDVSIAQERYRLGNGKYALNIAKLLDIVPIDLNNCKEIKVKSENMNNYTIVGISNNINPCRILSTPEGTIPMRLKECK